MDRYYDIHCHVFNKSVVSKRVVSLALPLFTMLDETEQRIINKRITKYSEDFEAFLKVAFKEKSKDVFDKIDELYQKQVTLVPMMVDFNYVDDNYGNRLENMVYKFKMASFIKLLKVVILRLKKRIVKDKALDEKLDAMLQESSGLINWIASLKEELFDTKNFEKQIADLEEIADNERALPFLSIDPRREYQGNENLLEMVKEKVCSQNGKFKGIKIYASAGFSPTDPVLFGYGDKDECIYKYCVENNIPITAHASNVGFTCMSSELQVRGHINVKEKIQFIKDGIHEFHYNFFSLRLRKAIQERAETLNHPKLWKIVMEKFPKLTINFAHFGGIGEIIEYIDYDIALKESVNQEELLENIPVDMRERIEESYQKYIKQEELQPEERKELWNALYHDGLIENWTKGIFEIIRNPKYPNTYTDLAFFSECNKMNGIHSIKDGLKKFKSCFYDNLNPYEQSKFLYGSDFFFTNLSGLAMEDYFNDFKEVFGDEDFRTIASTNPERFLGISQPRPL